MNFEKLRLVNFRNYHDVTVSFASRINFFIGENGQGKTNLLEALYLITNGNSFRYSDNSTLINNQSEESVIQSILTSNNLKYKLSLALSNKKKSIFINEKKTKINEIRKLFLPVIFSPESLSVIKEGSEYRRNLVDDLLISVSGNFSDLISEFKKSLRTRNKILKNYSSGEQDRKTTNDLLESINPIFFKYATDLSFARKEALLNLGKDLNNAMQYITENHTEHLSVSYIASDINIMNYSRNDIEQILIKRHTELQEAELSTGTSLIGPQKHDINFLYGEKDSRFYCSQGQQRAIILSFKIAQIVYHRKAHGIYPVLMLDDVLSELDAAKKNALIKFLHEINTQIFVTTTDITLPDHFSLDEISVLNIKEGQIL